jgi:hypothetical protein
MLNIVHQDTIQTKAPHEKNLRAAARERELNLIKKWYSKGYPITFSKTDNWIRIHNTTFNGYTRKMIEDFLNMDDQDDLQK